MGSGRRRAVLSNLLGNNATILITSIQAVVLIPLYINAVGTSLYGAWLGSGDVLIWMHSIDLGLTLMIQRIGTSHASDDKQKIGEYFTAGTIILTMVALFILLISTGLSFILPGLMSIHGQEAKILQKCFLLGSLAVALRMVSNPAYGLSLGIQDTAMMNATKVFSAVAGLVVSLWLVLTGWGLWSIAFGLLARALVFFLGSIVFVLSCLRKKTLMFYRVSPQVFREFIIVSPTVTLGNLGYALMNHSETAIAAIFISPESATVLTLTRKAIDVAMGLADSITYASFGSFAHLVASSQRHRSLKVLAEINSLRLSVAIALGSAYMAVNGSLVTLWVGSAFYGGALLTILLTLRFIVVGNSYLMNYLYRASGAIVRGSIALLVESAIRFPLMIGFLFWFGLPGLPIAGLVTSGVFGLLAYRWIVSDLSVFAESGSTFCYRTWIARLALFGVGMLVCLFVRWDTWIEVLSVGSAIALVGGAVLFFIDPLLRNTRVTLLELSKRLPGGL